MTTSIALEQNGAYDQATLDLNFNTTVAAGQVLEVLIDGSPVLASGIVTQTVTLGGTAATKHATQLKIAGAFASGTHNVTLKLLSSTADPSPELGVLSATLNGIALSGFTQTIKGTGAVSFSFGGTAPAVAAPITVGTGPDSVVLYIAEDAYLGNAEFTVSVSGKQIGSTLTATAVHSLGQSQKIIVLGDFAAGSTNLVSVDFLNQTSGSPATATDKRELYLTKATYALKTITGSTINFTTNGTLGFNFTVAGTATKLSLVGVNLAGGDFGSKIPGMLGTDYIYPTDAEVNYEISKGMNVLRIPFLAERVTTSATSGLNSTLMAPLDKIVNYATSQGAKVILDDHDYGQFYDQTLGQSATADGEFAKFWGEMAAHYASNPNVIFALNNEPHYQTPLQWEVAAQAAITAIRATGATQEILVSGVDWDSADNWDLSADGTTANTNAAALLLLKDPDSNLVFDVHNYLDPNNSGTGAAADTTTGVDRLQVVTQWAVTNHVKLFLSETGAPTDSISMQALNNELEYLQAHSNVWQGVTEWAAGPWWGNYNYSLEPTTQTANGVTTLVDKPQMAQLETYAPNYTGAPWVA